MKIEKGDTVEVINNIHDHGFFIGENVKIIDIDLQTDSYGCSNGSYFLLGRDEFKAIEPKTITTHENQPIQDFARQVAKTVKEDWGSHNVEEFVEAFKKEVGR